MIVPKKKKKVIQEFLVNIRERERGGWGGRCVYIHTRAMADGDLKIFSCYCLSYSYIFYKVQKNPVNPAFKVYPVSKYIHNKNISIFTTHNKCTILPCMNHYKNCLTSLSVSNLDHYSLLKTESILNSTLSIQWKNCY